METKELLLPKRSFENTKEFQWKILNDTNSVTALFSDKNIMWIGTYGGLIEFDMQKEEILNYYHMLNSRMPSNYITSLAKDKESIWIGTNNGLVHLKDGKWYVYNKYNSGLPDNYIKAIAVNYKSYSWSSVIWVGTRKGLAQYHGSWFILTKEKYDLPNNNITILAVDKKGNVWIGTEEGLAYYDGSIWKKYFEKYWQFEGQDVALIDDKYKGASISSITIDKTGRVWVCLGRDGLAVYDNDKMKIITDGFGEKDIFTVRVNERNIRSLAINKEGIYWLATPRNVAKLYGTEIVNYDILNFKGDFIKFLLVDSKDNLWIVSRKKILRHKEGSWINYDIVNNPSCSNHIEVICSDKIGNTWVLSDSCLIKYDQQKSIMVKFKHASLPVKYPKSMIVDNYGKVWVIGYGIACFDGKDWISYDYLFKDNKYLTSHHITCDINNNIWFTFEYTSNDSKEHKGIAKYNNLNLVVYDSESSELPNKFIKKIQTDNKGNLWLLLNNELVKFDGCNWTIFNSENSPIHYLHPESNGVNSFFIDNTDKIWFTLNYDGVAKFDGVQIVHYNVYNSDLPSNNAYFIKNIIDGVWIANDKGITIFDGKIWHTSNFSNYNWIPDEVTSLEIDVQKKIWIGFRSSGIIILDPEYSK